MRVMASVSTTGAAHLTSRPLGPGSPAPVVECRRDRGAGAGAGEPDRRPHRLQRRLLPPARDRPGVPWSPASATRRRAGPAAVRRSSPGAVDVAADGQRRPGDGRAAAGGASSPASCGRSPSRAGRRSGFEGTVTSTVPAGSGPVVELGALGRAHARARRRRRARARRPARGRAAPRSRPRCSPPACRAGSWTSSARCSASPTTRCCSTAGRSTVTPVAAPPLATRCSSSTPGVARTLAGSAYAERRAACEAAAARLGLAALRDATLDQVARRPDRPPRRHREPARARLRRRARGRATSTRSARCCSRATRACATTTRSRPPSSTCSSTCSSSTARSAPGSPAPASAAASSRSCSATTPTTARPRRSPPTDERTGLEPQAFVVRAVDGAGPVDPTRDAAAMKLAAADRLRPGPAPVADDLGLRAGRRARRRSTGRRGRDRRPAAGRRAHRRSSSAGAGSAGPTRASGARSSCPTTSGTTRSSPTSSDRCGTGGSSPTRASTRRRAAPQRARLGFASVDYFADVWLNDELLGHHEGYFAPFGFDVTDRLQKNNEVVVRVQDPLEPLDPERVLLRAQEADHQGHAEVPRQPARRAARSHGAPARGRRLPRGLDARSGASR